MLKRYQGLDSLRGFFCIIIAFCYHYFWIFPDGYGMKMPFGEVLYPFYKYGYLGVEFFFMLSGFGIAGNYADSLLRREQGFGKYIGKRIEKLYPMMWITLLVTTIGMLIYLKITGAVYYASSFTVYEFWLSFIGFNSGWFYNDANLNIPIWYISVLMLCYILYYCVSYLSKGSRFLYMAVSAFMAICGFGLLVPHSYYGAFGFENTGRGLLCFFGGVLLAELNREGLIKRELKKIMGCSGLLFSFLMLSVCMIYKTTAIIGNLRMMLILLIYPSLILAVTNVKIIENVLAWTPFKLLGKVSNSLYFWHYPAYLFVRIVANYVWIQKYYSSPIFYVLIIIYTMIIASISYLILEKKLIPEGIKGIKKWYRELDT